MQALQVRHDSSVDRDDARGPHDEHNRPMREAYETLMTLAGKKTGAIPAALIVEHVQAVAGASWELQRGALEAILKRIAAAKKEQLHANKPSGAGFLGHYTITRDGNARPYVTLISSVIPLGVSCSCADYRRNSLGVCKHTLCALEALCARRDDAIAAAAEEEHASTLRWDPIRPLHEASAAIERLSLDPGRVDLRLGIARRAFKHADGRCRLPAMSAAPSRLRLLRSLLRFATTTGGWHSRAEPAVAPILADEIERVQRVIEGRKLRRDARQHFTTLKRTLYPYQREGVERFLETGRLVLADDMGLGKTAQAIAAAHVLFAARQIRRILIVVPASLKSQWQREWMEFTDTPVTVVDGPASDRLATYRGTRRGALIVNYEQVVRDLDAVRGWDPELVVLDEAQRIKNWQTKTAASVKVLSPRWRLVLSGTPFENRLDELASLLDWIDDTALAPAWRLSAWHLVRCDGQREITGMRDVAALRERIAPHVLRRLRKDLLHQLPSRTDTRVPVELTAEQRAEHDELNLPIARLVAISKRRPLTQAEFLRLMSLLTTQRMLCNGIALARYAEVWPVLAAGREPTDTVLASLATPKLREIVEIVQRIVIEQQRKIIVFSQWRRMLALVAWALQPRLAAAGLRSVFFSGEESLARRTANVVAFHDDDVTRVMLATDAGGVGLNLQRAASCVVNLEVPWNPAILEQRVGRVHRNGQTQPVEVYNLVSVAGIEARIVDVVSDKRALFRGLFDGDSDEVTFEKSSSFLANLERVIEKATVDEPEPLRVDAEIIDEGDVDRDELGSSSSAAPAEEDVAEQTSVLAISERGETLDASSAADATPQSPTLANAVPIVLAALAKVQVGRTQGGEITITAPADIAPALGALFTTLGQALGATTLPA